MLLYLDLKNELIAKGVAKVKILERDKHLESKLKSWTKIEPEKMQETLFSKINRKWFNVC